MKIFIIYYLVSGLITAYWTYMEYDKMLEKYSILEIVSKEFLIFVQFLLGFLNLPILIFYKVRNIKGNIQEKESALRRELYNIECKVNQERIVIKAIDQEELTIRHAIDSLLYNVETEKQEKFKKCYIVIKEDIIQFIREDEINKATEEGWEEAVIITRKD